MKTAKKKKDDKKDSLSLSERNFHADPEYWGQPLWLRIYMRCLYAFVAFILTACFFSAFASSSFGFQCAMGGCVGLAVLLFRIAYPAGFGNITQMTSEAFDEAIAKEKAKIEAENEKKGKEEKVPESLLEEAAE